MMENDDIEITILEDDDLPIHPPDNPKEMFTWYAPADTNVRIVCARKVFEAVESFSKENKNKEVGGILLGIAYRHEGDIYVEIIELIKAPSLAIGQSGWTHFTFTDQAWAEMLRTKDRQYEQFKIVGWFHSHPGHRVFLSKQDLDIHNGHFKSPWHVAMVYDPVHHEGGFFVWDNGNIVSAGGFYERLELGQKKSKLTWKKPSPFKKSPNLPPAKNEWWKDPLEWVAGCLWSIILIGALVGFYLIWQYIRQEVDTVSSQQQSISETQQAEIVSLKKTLVAIDNKFPTATLTETLTPTLTLSPTITPTPTTTYTPTEIPAPTNAETLVPTDILALTESPTATGTATVTP